MLTLTMQFQTNIPPMDCIAITHLGLEDNFTFSCSDLNNSSGTDGSEDDDNSYIEIALDRTEPTCYRNSSSSSSSDDEVYELRISFSSASIPNANPPRSSSSSSSHGSHTPKQRPAVHDHSLRSVSSEGLARQRQQHTLQLDFPILNTTTNENLGHLVRTSKLPKSTSTTTSSGSVFTKFLIKFGSVNKVQKLMKALVKPGQQPCRQANDINIGNYKSKKKHEEISPNFQCYQKKTTNPASDKHWYNIVKLKRNSKKGSSKRCAYDSGNNNSSRTTCTDQRYSKVLDAIFRGVLEAVGTSIKIVGKERSKNKTSCPTSCKTSPLHEGFALHATSDNSYHNSNIQSAIAHCKTSFAMQTSH
ncbi:hypothetical protein O6P43_016432 [Quillaja saponaria]|uniref:Uncharacterized protein n=1 Tax=Quillaja saponaria TaxID=32244 RepID=A0AAD7LMZ0_QUISA|nr:hypothetical protein O6P43_016432 [Quillaja saponaria]